MATTSPSQLTSSAAGSNPTAASSGSGFDTLIGSEGNTSQHDVVGFTSVGQSTLAEYVRPQTLDELMDTMKASADGAHDVTSFLGRPVKLTTLRMSTLDEPGKINYTVAIEDAFKSMPQFRLHREKLSGYYGFSATAVLKLVLNPQPFEAGVYTLFYAPLYAGDDEQDFFWPITGNFSSNYHRLPFTSGLPNKIFNINKVSDVELRVPYIAPNVFYNLTEPLALWGTVFFQCICPFATGNTASVSDATLYLSFEDVKLFGAARPFTPQGPMDLISLPPTSEYTERTQGTNQSGPKISDIANTVSSIPFLPAIAPEVTMTAKAVGAIASQFGFSKPNADPVHSRMAITPFGQPQNVDATSNAFKMGTSEVQNGEIIPMGPTEEDEMTILSLVNTPQFQGNFTWTTQQTAGTLLSSWPVNPNCERERSGDIYPHRLYYISQLFRYWRGTIKATFHVAATNFHSGRIRFVYDLDSRSAPNIPDLAYNFSDVREIRGGTSFTIPLPYFSTTPFRVVPTIWSSSNGFFITDSEQATGTRLENALYCFVENQLVAPDNVSSSITIAVYFSAGDDFELACPQITKCAPYNTAPSSTADSFTKVTSTPTSPTFEVTDSKGRKKIKKLKDIVNKRSARAIYKESKERNPCNNPFDSQAIGDPAHEDDVPEINICGDFAGPETPTMRASEIAVGEKVVSLRELTKRYMRTGNTNNTVPWQTMVLLPFLTPHCGLISGVNYFSTTYLNRIMPLYRFRKGGMRFMLRTEHSSQTGWPNLTAQFVPNTGDIDFSTGDPLFMGTHSCVFPLKVGGNDFDSRFMIDIPSASQLPVSQHLQGGLEIQVPYYSRYPFVTNRAIPRTNLYEEYIHSVSLGEHPTGIVVLGMNAATGKWYTEIYQAAADDFQLGFKLGAPVCLTDVTYDMAGTFSD